MVMRIVNGLECLLSVKEAEAFLGVSHKKMRVLMAGKRLPVIDLGARTKRFAPEALRAFLANRTRK